MSDFESIQAFWLDSLTKTGLLSNPEGARAIAGKPLV